jgi:hypothetical protein
MFRPRALIILLVPFFLFVFSTPSFAQAGSRLKVCNTGKVAVEVAIASSYSEFLKPNSDYWTIKPYTVAPDDCAIVYDQSGPNQAYCFSLPLSEQLRCDNPPVEALVGFGFRDAARGMVSLEATPPPDFGVYSRSSRKVLWWDHRSLCVDPGAPGTRPPYVTRDSKLPGVCASGFVPIASAYNFYPNAAFCGGVSQPGVRSPGCAGGNYLLTVSAVPANHEVDVSGGVADDDFKPVKRDPEMERVENAAREALKKEFEEAIKQGKEEEAKRREAADPINQAAANRKIFEARRDSIDYAAEHTRNIGRIRDLTQFSPDWLRSADPILYVRGTVSRVEPPNGLRQPARLYFKESPDNAFIACIPVPQLFDLQKYAGKYLEVRGRVSQSNCGGKVADVQVVNPAMILDLANGTPSDEAALPGMTVSPPPNKGGPAVFTPPPPGRDRNDRSDAAQRPRNEVPQQPPSAPTPAPSSTATAPTQTAPSSAATSTAPSPIPPGTRIEVTLMEPVDLLHANDGDTFRAQVLRASAPGGGNAPSVGSAVTLRFARTPAPGVNGFNTVSLTLQSVTLNGQPVFVSSNAFTTAVPTAATAGPSATFRAGMRLFFIVSGTR